MPKLKPDVQRARSEHILDAAERCFARAGFHRTSIHDICKEAGISPGALYVYFDSKEALIAGISERDRAEFAERLATLADGPRLSWKRCARSASSIFSKSRPTCTACASTSAWSSTRNPRVGEIHQRFDRFIVESFEKLFQKLKDEGRIAPDARHPDRGQSVHGHLRRHVLAPRRRSRLSIRKPSCRPCCSSSRSC